MGPLRDGDKMPLSVLVQNEIGFFPFLPGKDRRGDAGEDTGKYSKYEQHGCVETDTNIVAILDSYCQILEKMSVKSRKVPIFVAIRYLEHDY